MRWDKDHQTDLKTDSHIRPTFLVVVPTFGMISIEYHIAAQRLQAPVNALVQSIVPKGMEVGKARDYAIKQWIAMGDNRPKYLFFFGDDMIPEWWHLIALWEEMRKGQWDVLAGLYYFKQEHIPVPILWRAGIDGWLRENEHYQPGEVVLSDIAGMDFTLIDYRIIPKLTAPYFKTSFVDGDQIKSGSIQVHTEDAYFCEKVRLAGGKVGVHTGVRVAHMDIKTGEMY